ncbi:MAG: alpha/beta hydrolase family esterase [Anaerolineae bacterium]
MIRILRRLFIGVLVTAVLLAAVPAVQAGSFVTQTYNGRTYKLYIPGGYTGSSSVPLVVMLHGCTQDPDDFAAGTRMNSYAESNTFQVLYPEQTDSANITKCWNWYEPAHQARGSGEPALIAGMTQQVINTYAVDTDRVYVAGISAGASMSVIMGATYPDLYAAIGVTAGTQYKAATSALAAPTAMIYGGPNPNTQGTLAYNAMGSQARVVPTIVFHGNSDLVVYPVNAYQVIDQWAQTNDLASDGVDNNNIDGTPDQYRYVWVPGGKDYTYSAYEDSTGKVIMERYMVNAMGHAWSGGSYAGSYTDPWGPNATYYMLDFFFDNPK